MSRLLSVREYASFQRLAMWSTFYHYLLMRFYSLWALLKVIMWLAILRVIYHYVQVFQQPLIGLSLGFLGIFLSVWGWSYFFFLLCYKLFSSRQEQRQNTESYTHSLLLGVRVMVQITLMMTYNRSLLAAWWSLLIFLILHLSVVHDTGKITV